MESLLFAVVPYAFTSLSGDNAGSLYFVCLLFPIDISRMRRLQVTGKGMVHFSYEAEQRNFSPES